MRFLVHGYRAYGVLDSKVFELAVVIDAVLMKNGDGTAVARDVDALKPRIELDDIRSACQRQKRNGDVLVQIEDGHQFVSLTGKERAVVLRVKRHAVISLAFPDRVPAYNFVGRGINDSKNVLVLEVHVDLPRHGIVLRHPRFAVKVQSLHDLVFVDRKSTRLNSSHGYITHAVFCLKKNNLKLLRRITRTENILHRNFTRRQVAIQNRVASNIGIRQSTFSVKVLNLFSRSRRKTNKRKSKHSAMLRNKETRHRMFIFFFNTTGNLAYLRFFRSISITA